MDATDGLAGPRETGAGGSMVEFAMGVATVMVGAGAAATCGGGAHGSASAVVDGAGGCDYS